MRPEGQAKLKAFHRFRESAASCRKMRDAIVRMGQQRVARSLGRWLEAATEASAWLARVEAGVVRLSPEGRAKSRAFHQLRYGADLVHITTGAITRLRKRTTSRAFESWQSLTEQGEHIEQQLRRVFHRKLALAFDAWVLAPPHPAHGFIARLSNQPCVKAFDLWHSRYLETVHLRTALAHLVHHGQAIGFRTWLRSQELDAVKSESLRRYIHRGLARGLNGWINYADARLATLDQIKVASISFTQTTLLRSWSSWAGCRRSQPDALPRALAHFTKQSLSKSLASWFDHADWVLVRKRALAALSRRREHTALQHWRGWIFECTAWRMHVERSHMRMRSPIFGAFRRWEGTLGPLGPMRAALTKLRARNLSRALNSWQSWLFLAQLKRRGVLAAQRMPNARAFRCLRAHALRAHEARSLLQRTRRLATPLLHALALWRSCAILARPLHRAANHFLQVGLGRGLKSLEANCARRRKMRRAAAFCLHRAVAVGLRTWARFTMERISRVGRADAALRVLLPDGKAKLAVIGAWKRMLAQGAMMRRGVAAFARRGAVRALRRWRLLASEAVWARELLARSALHHIFAAFVRWRHSHFKVVPMTRVQKDEHRVRMKMAAAYDVWYDSVAERWLTKRALVALTLRTLVRAMRTWAGRADELLMMSQACSALMHQRASRGLNRWFLWYDSRLERRTKVDRILRSMRSVLRFAFGRWSTWLTVHLSLAQGARYAMRAGQARAFRAWLHAVSAVERMHRAMAHFAGQGLVRALGSWEDHLRKLRLQRQGAAALVDRGLRMGFSTWRSYLMGRAASRAMMQHAEARLRVGLVRVLMVWLDYLDALEFRHRAIASFGRAGLKRGFNALVARVAHAKVQRERMRIACTRCSSREGDAFNTWKLLPYERQLRERALLRYRAHGLRRATDQWVEFVVDKYERLEQVAAARASLLPGLRSAMRVWRDSLKAADPLRRSLAHLYHRGISRGWCSWCELIVEIARKQTAMMHLLNAMLARGVRAWVSFTDERQLMCIAFIRLRLRLLHIAFHRWEGSAAAREEKGRVMRGKLSIALGSRKLEAQALNSWKHIMYEHRRMRRGLSRFLNHEVARAWAHWHHMVAQSAKVRQKLLGLRIAGEKRVLCRLRNMSTATKLRRRSLAHLRSQGELRGLCSWCAYAIRTRRGRQLMARVAHARQLSALKEWQASTRCRVFLQAVIGAWRQRTSRAALNSWCGWVVIQRVAVVRGRTALSRMLNVQLQHAMNAWRHRNLEIAPLRRGVALWGNRPAARCLATMREYGRQRRWLRAHANRWHARRLVGCLNRWSAGAKERRRRVRGLRAIGDPPVRRAVNTWVALAVRRRKLKGMVGTLLEPTRRRALNRWKLGTRFHRPKHTVSLPHTGMRFIKALTWREACSWLNSIGVRVSRSPPTLLRSLKEGLVYQELVRKIAPYYFLRHNVASSNERGAGSVFVMVQHFFDTELVVSIIGCQKLDILSLATGKAREHLDLVETFRTIHTARVTMHKS